MSTVLILAYTAWAIFSGYRFLSGRSQWLDSHTPASIIVKLLLSVAVGYVIGAFYLIYLILRMLGLFSRM